MHASGGPGTGPSALRKYGVLPAKLAGSRRRAAASHPRTVSALTRTPRCRRACSTDAESGTASDRWTSHSSRRNFSKKRLATDWRQRLGLPSTRNALGGEFLKPIFRNFFTRLDLPNLAAKTNLHVLAEHVLEADTSSEVARKLDAIARVAEEAKQSARALEHRAEEARP